jgi:hypothetical protein
LTEQELKLVDILIKGFKLHDKSTPIKSSEILKCINSKKEQYGFEKDITGVMVRKYCNFIRLHGLIPLIATSSGYYVSYEREDIKKQIRSLYERAKSIKDSADGLLEFL